MFKIGFVETVRAEENLAPPDKVMRGEIVGDRTVMDASWRVDELDGLINQSMNQSEN